MSCNHDTIADIQLDDEFVLVYCGTEFKEAVFVKGEVISSHTVEVFNSAQELIDRGVELGLQCTTEHLIKAMEYGATLPADHLAYLLSYIWQEDIGLQTRMVGLGFPMP